MDEHAVYVIAQEPGRTVRLHQIVRSLRKFGYRVDILMPRISARFRPRLLSGALRYLGIMLQVLFLKADIYYVFNNPDIGFPVLLKRGTFIYDVRNPWGAEVYDLTRQLFAAKVAERIEHVMTRSADVVIAVNANLAKRAEKWGAKKVFVVPNYPARSFKPRLSGEGVRERFGLERKKFALFTGNFSEVECAFDLVKLFTKVSERVPNAVLVMIGDGTQKPLMEKFIKEHGLADTIRLMTRIPRNEVPDWLAAADVILVPRKANMRSSQYYYPEGIWKVTEALSIGKPIVAGAVGGFIDTTLPIKAAPLEKFPEAIIKIFEKPPRIRPLKEISWDHSEEQLRKALESIDEIVEGSTLHKLTEVNQTVMSSRQ